MTDVSSWAMMPLNESVRTPPERKMPVGEVTPGETWSVSVNPLSSIERTPEVAISSLNGIVPLVRFVAEARTRPVT